MTRPFFAFLQLAATTVATLACSKENSAPLVEALPSVAPDRLAPGEPLIGSQQIWGIRVPDGFIIASQHARKVHLTGSRPLPALIEALREQVTASHIEVTPSRIVIERAYAKGASERKLLRIEALVDGTRTRVYISDITPEPAPSGMSAAEAWERAGRNPDGTIKNPSQVL